MKDWKIKLFRGRSPSSFFQKLAALVAIFLACFIVDMKFRGYSSERKEDDGSVSISCIGKVVGIDAARATGEPPSWTLPVDGQILTLRVLSGKYKGQEVLASNVFKGDYTDRVFKKGDRVYLSISSGAGLVLLGEYVRTTFLLYLAAVFMGLVVIIGGIKGVKTVAALVVSGVFIISVLIPMALRGYNPVWASILISSINTVLTFMLVGGTTRKSVAGILGTIGGLMMTALLASISSRILHFSGLDINFGFLELGRRLWMAKESAHWNFEGLLVSGMILGASGAMMDASMAVASAIEEVKKANPHLGIWRCIMAGLNVGKDEMGTMASTLIFAYIGADITLILTPMIQFGEAGRVMPLTKVINEEASSAEVVQALAGTIGLIMAIPITAFIAGFLIGRQPAPDAEMYAEPPRQAPTVKRLRSSMVIPVALLVITIGAHVTYIVTRHASAAQTGGAEEKTAVSEFVRARVIEKGEPISVPSPDPNAIKPAEDEILKARLLGGSFKGQEVLVQNVLDPNRMPLANVEVKPGDDVLLKVEGTDEGIGQVFMNNYSRDGFLIYLAALFVFLMVIVGRLQGIRTAIALGISIAIVFKVLIPLIMAGYNAVLVVIVVSGVIAFSSLIIITGFNRKAGSATIGILGGVVIASLIVLYADQRLHFTGISSSRTAVIAQFTVAENLDFRKILMAGIIMGLLGTAMDAAVVIASAVREVRRVNPGTPVIKLIRAGMNVGTDLLGTMSNTLIFAYMGLRIILLMTFAGTSMFAGSKLEIMSAETMSAEALRLLAGSIGLVLTIPITAVVASLWDRLTGFLGFASFGKA